MFNGRFYPITQSTAYGGIILIYNVMVLMKLLFTLFALILITTLHASYVILLKTKPMFFGWILKSVDTEMSGFNKFLFGWNQMYFG